MDPARDGTEMADNARWYVCSLGEVSAFEACPVRSARAIFMGVTSNTQQAPLGPVGFIGAGKVGTALAALLHERGVPIGGVSGRTLADGRRMALAARLDPSAAGERADTLARSNIVFLTVPDDVIGPLCMQIAEEGGWRAGMGVVHCSGVLSSDVLEPARKMGAQVASFHPLQAFASLEAALRNLPGSVFALEGDAALVEQLDRLVGVLGGAALRVASHQKALYHAAAAIASNYTVTLTGLAAQLMVSEGIAPDINTALRYMLPLLKGTVENLAALGLPEALTGPLARGDVGTVARHVQALDRSAPELAHLYRHLGRLTLPLAIRKGGLGEAVVRELQELLKDTA